MGVIYINLSFISRLFLKHPARLSSKRQTRHTQSMGAGPPQTSGAWRASSLRQAIAWSLSEIPGKLRRRGGKNLNTYPWCCFAAWTCCSFFVFYKQLCLWERELIAARYNIYRHCHCYSLEVVSIVFDFKVALERSAVGPLVSRLVVKLAFCNRIWLGGSVWFICPEHQWQIIIHGMK